MKKLNGITLLLISIAITTLGSVFKIINAYTISEALLGIGVITFFVAIGMLIYRLVGRRTA